LGILANGISVIFVNSVHRRSYIAGVSFFGVLGAVVAVLASRWHGGGHSASSSSFLAPFYSLSRRRLCLSPCSVFPDALLISGEPAPSLLCFPVAAKLVSASLTPCASSRPTNSSCLSRELELHRFLPRGRQRLRRARFAAARAPRCISVLGFG